MPVVFYHSVIHGLGFFIHRQDTVVQLWPSPGLKTISASSVLLNIRSCEETIRRLIIWLHCSSVSGQDAPNPGLWLATRAGKMERTRWSYLARSGLPAVSRKKNFPWSRIINPLLTKLIRSRWLHIGLVLFFSSLWTATPSRSINTQKKNLANIQTSWPHTWSITHIYWNNKTTDYSASPASAEDNNRRCRDQHNDQSAHSFRHTPHHALWLTLPLALNINECMNASEHIQADILNYWGVI